LPPLSSLPPSSSLVRDTPRSGNNWPSFIPLHTYTD
jgi:hypothetical protein